MVQGYRNYKITSTSKEILKLALLTGAIYVSVSSPYFVFNLAKNLFKGKKNFKNKKDAKKIENAFNYLRRRNLIEVDKEGFRVRISLTEEGKKKVGKYQINDLKIEKLQEWDEKWRIVIFDIPHTLRLQRNAFREKLKELGFYCLQKSVWVYLYDCSKEIKLMRDFFGLKEEHIRIIVTENIGDNKELKKFFRIRQ